MPRKRTNLVVRVFVASPSDVNKERDCVDDVIAELNRTTGGTLGIRLESVRWETHAAPLMGRPEQVILDQIPIDQCDVFVGILWTRFGTPTGGVRGPGSSEFLSGTEEEFELAYKLWQNTMRPKLLFYRCIKPTQYITDINTDQYSKVDSFFRDFSHDKSHPGLIRTFLESHEFEWRLREDLTYVLRQFSEPDSARKSPDLGPAHSDLGFTRLYLPVNNDDRNRSKQEALQTATEIRLLAHTGQSYLSSVGPRFRQNWLNGEQTEQDFAPSC